MGIISKEKPSTCTIRGRKFIHGMPAWKAKQYTKWIEKALNVTDTKLDLLRKASMTEDTETADLLVLDLLTSKKSKMAGVIRYALRLSAKDRPTLYECVKCIQMLDLQKPLKEKARVYPKKKVGKDEWRPIAEFGIQHRAAQKMIEAILGPTFKPRKFQFTQRGVPQTIARVRARADAGHHHFVQQDISGFFLHFEEDALKMALPLPTWAVEHVVMGRQTVWAGEGAQLSFHLWVSHSMLIQQARRGLPQGSSTSSIIAMIECAKLKLSHELESALFNYADDFLSLFKTAEEAVSAAEELQDAVGELPGGNFSLKQKGIGHLSKGCTFLGHHIQLVDGVLRIAPSDQNYIRLTSRLEAIEKACGAFSIGVIGEKFTLEQKHKVLQAIADSCHYLNSWLAAFSECTDLDDGLIMDCEKNILMMMVKVGAKPEDLAGLTGSEAFSFDYSG